MDGLVMTNDELNAWRMIGADMGLEFDELGHPYKPGPARDGVTLEFYQGAYDWRPLEDDGDCLGLLMHYNLSVECAPDCVRVATRAGVTQALSFHAGQGTEGRAALRRAVFMAAANEVRGKLRVLDSVNRCSLNML